MTDNIISKTFTITRVPFNSAVEYSENQKLLVDEVNKTLTAQFDLKRLIGQKPLTMMCDNHTNHASFMSNVFKLNDFELMSNVIIWVYHTYHDQGFSYDYFPVALKAWVKAIEKHLDPSKTGPLVRVYEWIIENHELFIETSLKVEKNPLLVEQKWQELKEAFMASLVTGGHRKSIKLAIDNVHTAADLTEFYLQVIQPAMYEIGALWEKGELSVAREHLASAIVTRVMAALYPKFIILEQTKGKAIVTAAPNEYHEIGPRMVADLLELDGWDVDYTGANTPPGDLLDLMAERNPYFVAISVGMPFNIDRTVELVKMIRGQRQFNDTKIMLGGQSLNMSRQIRQIIGVDSVGDSARDAVSISSEWWHNG
jgi:MerR family transcriptional regulator, light-induced transcriptional regulator